MPPASAHVAFTGDGESLTYRVHGHLEEPAPVLAMNGLVSSGQHWGFFLPHYAERRRVVAWDYRGHGGQFTPRDPAGVSVAQFADDAHAVWRAAGQPPVVVAGLSFGVQVALELWRRHPEAVRALVLICGTAGRPLDRLSSSPLLLRAVTTLLRRAGTKRKEAVRLVLPLLRTRVGQRLGRELAYLTGGAHRDECPPEVLESLFGHVSALDPTLLFSVAAAYLEHDAFDVLPSITVPTLIIAGDKDELTPVETAERMHAAVRGSKLVVFPGHSHLVQVEKPREVHAVIDAFLEEHRL